MRESIMRMTWRACAAETSGVRWSRRCGMLSRPTWVYARATAWIKPAPPCLLTTSAGMREAPTKPAIDAVFTMAPPVVRKNDDLIVTPPSPRAGIHGAIHSGVDRPPLVDALEYGADMLAVAPATVEVAAGSLAPRSYAGDPHDNAAPMLSACIAGDVLSEGS